MEAKANRLLVLPIFLLVLLSSCSKHLGDAPKWRVKDLAAAPYPKIRLLSGHERVVATVDRITIQKLLLAKLRIARTANVNAELYVEAGKAPNAYAGYTPGVPGYGPNGKPILGITTGMLALLGNNTDAGAALLGHEIAHFTKGHHESAKKRSTTLNAIGQAAALGLAAAGIPMSGYITGFAVDLIDSAYSRDQEREADEAGMDYMIAAGYNPKASLYLHEELMKASGGALLPFLSTHPSGNERIASLEKMLQERGYSTNVQP